MEDPYGLKKKRCRYKEKMDKALQILSRIGETHRGLKTYYGSSCFGNFLVDEDCYS